MNQVATTKQTETKPSLVGGGGINAIVPQSIEEIWRLSQIVVASGMAPKSVDTVEKAAVAIMHGMEVGFTPLAALQSIAPINGYPTIWGDGALALVQASGLLEWHEETDEGEGDNLTAVCIVKRRGDPKLKRGEFSVADAKKAGLWTKKGPWENYPDRMRQMRARAYALRDGFADVLRGLKIREEVSDYQEMRDVTPRQVSPLTDRLAAARSEQADAASEGFDLDHVNKHTGQAPEDADWTEATDEPETLSGDAPVQQEEPYQDPGHAFEGDEQEPKELFDQSEHVEGTPAEQYLDDRMYERQGEHPDLATFKAKLKECGTPEAINALNHEYAKRMNKLSEDDKKDAKAAIQEQRAKIGGGQ